MIKVDIPASPYAEIAREMVDKFGKGRAAEHCGINMDLLGGLLDGSVTKINKVQAQNIMSSYESVAPYRSAKVIPISPIDVLSQVRPMPRFTRAMIK